MLSKNYYESEGIRLMELGEDEQARNFLEQAARLGSERAKVCLHYLNLNVCDEDFCKTESRAQSEDVFDYDLQPLYHVSRIQTALQRSFQSMQYKAEYICDDILSKGLILIRRMAGSFVA